MRIGAPDCLMYPPSKGTLYIGSPVFLSFFSQIMGGRRGGGEIVINKKYKRHGCKNSIVDIYGKMEPLSTFLCNHFHAIFCYHGDIKQTFLVKKMNIYIT